MPRRPDWKQALETGQEFTEMTRQRARELAERLVDQGQLTQQQVQRATDEILRRSRQRTKELRRFVDERIQAQLHALGVATRRDLAELERRLLKASRPTATKRAPAKAKSKTSTSTAAKRAPAKRTAAAQAPAGGSPAA